MKNKLKIVFDANPMAQPKKTGVGWYTYNLIINLAKQYPDKFELIGYYYNFLGRKHPKLPIVSNIKYKPIRFYPGKVVNLLRRFGIEIPFEILAKTKADIGLFPNFLSQPSIFNTPTIPVIHDLSFINLPDFSADRNRNDLMRFVPKTLNRASFAITVSEKSKKTIASKFGFPSEKILVTYVPTDPPEKFNSKEVSSALKKLGINKPFLLFVGTLEPRKNLVNLLIAYEQSKYLSTNYALVIAGQTDWKFEETVNKIEDLKVKGFNVVQTGYVSQHDKNVLYDQASLFVYPSQYEGFGMTILEAFNYHTPACLSDIEVFHEVAGSAAIYFNQNNPGDITNKLEFILKNQRAASELIKKGQEKLKDYSWEKVSKSVYSLLSTL